MKLSGKKAERRKLIRHLAKAEVSMINFHIAEYVCNEICRKHAESKGKCAECENCPVKLLH